MTGQPASLANVVDLLRRAHQGGPAADETAALPHVTSLDEAYAVQEGLYAALGHPPGVAPYWKSGAPTRSDAMRHAPLPVAGVRPSGSGVEGLHLRHRWIEAEVALRIARELTPEAARRVTPHDAHAVVDAMCVSIELVDTRWAGGRSAPPLLKVADLVVHGALVLGDFVPFASRRWEEQECRVRIGAAEARAFRGSLGIGDPAWVLPEWLRHLTRHGASVPAGTVVTTGTWCGLLDAAEGDRVVAEFPGIGSASVQL
ncbi:fumarylacetoacetate hydrolase family protein [Ramlibacter pallidus]|uniref:Fumarylacetoacetate hydrolase family protein n=1 Tax=Ramlibacter pallidus TaxID=2780087 RepID=A0ABR9S6E6_9BURK|nr:fumarylacetoacetate hydrolase family protein [Ramlibacter pallidus]MBE7369031.1 fumarylacetoacetate hydrolase family protein [Ramlibacter pallidus]